jgi:hypothetical protein
VLYAFVLLSNCTTLFVCCFFLFSPLLGRLSHTVPNLIHHSSIVVHDRDQVALHPLPFQIHFLELDEQLFHPLKMLILVRWRSPLTAGPSGLVPGSTLVTHPFVVHNYIPYTRQLVVNRNLNAGITLLQSSSQLGEFLDTCVSVGQQKATWERSFDPTLQSMTLEEYATSDKAESNWMVWMLNNEPVVAMDERHLKIAKQILREKVLIGLTQNMEESVQRFYSYFGWNRDEYGWSPCERDSLFGGTNSNKHPKVKEGTKAWELLASRNALDIALYEYAVELFHDQSSLFHMPVTKQPNVRGRR